MQYDDDYDNDDDDLAITIARLFLWNRQDKNTATVLLRNLSSLNVKIYTLLLYPFYTMKLQKKNNNKKIGKKNLTNKLIKINAPFIIQQKQLVWLDLLLYI